MIRLVLLCSSLRAWLVVKSLEDCKTKGTIMSGEGTWQVDKAHKKMKRKRKRKKNEKDNEENRHGLVE